MLGFDQYCQSLKKLMDYMDGKYKSSENNPHSKFSIDQKCKKGLYDYISWIEFFFRTDLYIIGFGMDFSEIDIWWLSNKRARLQLDMSCVNNQIVYI